MCTQTTVSRSGRCSRHQLHSSGVLWRPLVSTVSFSAVARLLAREQLPRHLLHENLLLAPQRKRSGAPDPVCEANMKHTVWVKRVRFFCVPAVSPSVHARSARVGTGERESGRDRGQQLVVRGLLRSPTGKLDMRVARIPPIGAWSRYLKGTSAHVALELTHVEPVDQRSGTRKADEVWHFWERPGQRHDALKRVAQTPACRLLFLVGVKHVGATTATRMRKAP